MRSQLFRIGFAVLLGMLVLAGRTAHANDRPDVVRLPDQEILGYKFSAVDLLPKVPALQCVVTGPPDAIVRLRTVVFLFESIGAATPYAQVSGSTALTRQLQRQQWATGAPEKDREEIQVTTIEEVRVKKVAMPVP